MGIDDEIFGDRLTTFELAPDGSRFCMNVADETGQSRGLSLPSECLDIARNGVSGAKNALSRQLASRRVSVRRDARRGGSYRRNHDPDLGDRGRICRVILLDAQ